MPGGTGTTIIGFDSDTEAGVTSAGPAAAKSWYHVLAAAASGTPDTAWVKFGGTQGDVKLCVWDNTTGDLLVESDIFDNAAYSTTAGVWNEATLIQTAALTASTSYRIGFFQQANYQQIRYSDSGYFGWYRTDSAGSWSTTPDPFGAATFIGDLNSMCVYFSQESGASAVAAIGRHYSRLRAG